MKRKSFLRHILTILVAPKVLVETNDKYMAERQRRWKECFEYAKAKQKMDNIKNQIPPRGKGYVIHKGELKILYSKHRVLSIYSSTKTS